MTRCLDGMRSGPLLGALLAALAAAPGAGQVPYTEVAASLGIVAPLGPSGPFGGGALFDDIDGNGYPDLVVPGGAGFPIYVYKNTGAGTFVNVTGQVGFPAGGQSKGIAGADIDNDGDLDLFLTRYFEPNALLLNLGNGAFQEITAAAGLSLSDASYGACFGDYDRDGFVDLYVAVYSGLIGQGNHLYRNNGDLTFTEVTAQAGVANFGLSFQAIFLDYDKDLWPDLFIANDRGYLNGTIKNTLYRNLGNGTFADVSQAAGVNYGIDAMGADAADIDGDGDQEIYVTNVPLGNLFHMNDCPSGTFTEEAAANGTVAYRYGWGTAFFDADDDGDLDLYACNVLGGSPPTGANQLFRNDSNGFLPLAFTDAAPALGVADPQPSYGIAVADFDRDGGLDLFLPDAPALARLYKHPGPANHWIGLALDGTRSNRRGIGARVRLLAGGQWQTREVRAGSGFCSGSEIALHFGLGSLTVVTRIEVLWPSGASQTLTNLAADQWLVIEEPRMTLVPPPAPGVVSAVTFRAPGDAGFPFVGASSFSAIPGIGLADGRRIPLTPDPLFSFSLLPSNPVFSGFSGLIGVNDEAAGSIAVPALPSLSGLQCVLAFLTVDLSLPVPFRSISAAFPVTLP